MGYGSEFIYRRGPKEKVLKIKGKKMLHKNECDSRQKGQVGRVEKLRMSFLYTSLLHVIIMQC